MVRMKSMSAVLMVLLLVGCGGGTQGGDVSAGDVDLPRIAIAGIAIESSTFSPAQTTLDGFRVTRGEEILGAYPFLSEDSPARDRAVWFPTLRGRAIPGGIVTREAYESMTGEILKRLEAVLPLDGLFFDIHGAMSVVGLDDPEGDLLARIRDVVGTDVLVSTSMDLHGNVSERLARETDLITCYRMAPHEDAMESKQRAAENLLDRLESGMGKPPFKAWIPVPILLPGEKTSTRIEPARSLYAEVEPITQRDGVTDAAIWIGYAWADEPRNRAVVMAYGDNEAEVSRAAEELAEHFWRIRREFDFVAPTTTLETALETAVASSVKPFIISDMGDNPTAGGAGDVTWTLARILERPEFKIPDGPSLIYASIPGPALVEEAMEAGVGGQVDGVAGAMVDDRYSPPVRLQGVYVTDGEIEQLKAYWREELGEESPKVGEAPWEELLHRQASLGDQDEILEQAIELVRQRNEASASLLQRGLRIGYPRAARLMDQLEELGVVGRPQAGGRTREVLMGTDEDPSAPTSADEEKEDST